MRFQCRILCNDLLFEIGNGRIRCDIQRGAGHPRFRFEMREKFDGYGMVLHH